MEAKTLLFLKKTENVRNKKSEERKPLHAYVSLHQTKVEILLEKGLLRIDL